MTQLVHYTARYGMGRRKTARVLLTVLCLPIVFLAVGWWWPSGTHDLSDDWASRLPKALTPLGKPDRLPGSPSGDLGSISHASYGVRGRSVGTVVVSVFRYRNDVQGAIRTWLQQPGRNGIVWDQPAIKEVAAPGAGLPDKARVFGLECQGDVCDRYVVWWPEGADLVLVDVRPGGLTRPTAALRPLFGLWRG